MRFVQQPSLCRTTANRAVLIGTLLLVSFPLTGCATNDPTVHADITAIRGKIKNKGSQVIVDYDRGITTSAPVRKLPTAFYYRDGETVTITSGMRTLVERVADLSIVSRKAPANFELCRYKYVDAVRRDFSLQAFKKKISLSNLRLGIDIDNAVPELGTYFSKVRGGCSKYASEFPIRQSDHKARNAIASNLIQLIYLHEIGHKNHKTGYEVRGGGKMSQEILDLLVRSRQQEFEADEFSLNRWVELHDDPMQLMNTAFIDWHRATGGVSCRRDKRSTHASGDVRAMVAIKKMRKLAKQAGKYFEKPKRRDQLDRFIKITESRVEFQKCPKL